MSLDTDVEIQHHGNDQGNSVSHDTKGKSYSWTSIPSIVSIKIHALKKKVADFISSLYPSAYLLFFFSKLPCYFVSPLSI